MPIAAVLSVVRSGDDGLARDREVDQRHGQRGAGDHKAQDVEAVISVKQVFEHARNIHVSRGRL